MNNEVYSVGDGRIITLVVRETIYNLRIPSPVVSQKGRKAGDPGWLSGYHTPETGYLSNGVHGQVPRTL